MTSPRDVVCVSALGLVSPLGESLEAVSEALYEGRSGIRRIEKFSTESLETKWAGIPEYGNQVIRWPHPAASPPARPGEALYAERAVGHLLAQVNPLDLYAADRLGCILGVDEPTVDPEKSIELVKQVGLDGILDRQRLLTQAAQTFRISQLLDLDVTSALRAIHRLLPFRGLSRCHVGLCSASLQALGMARTAILAGKIDAAIIGGVSAKVTPANLARLESIGAVCTDAALEGSHRSRPFDARRSGFVPAEGAVLMLMEREEAVLRRRGRSYLRVLGYGASLGAEHIVQPHSKSLEMRLSMSRALKMAGLPLDAFSNVNAHGTSTKLNDLHESQAIAEVFGGRPPPVTATKSNHGHLIAAAGAMELVGVIATFEHSFLPPVMNLDEVGNRISVPLVRTRADGPVHSVLKNSFGMGGLAASAVLQHPRATH